MSTHPKTARNIEITRRVLAGETRSALALELGCSISRVSQIVTKFSPIVDQEPTHTASPRLVRPRIRKVESGLWECSEGGIARAAHTAQGAYQRWLTAALRAELERAPAVVPPKPVASPRPRRPRAAPPVVAKPPKPAEPVRPAETPAFQAHQVTVLPGLAARSNWGMSAAMRVAAERAQADQRPIRGIGARGVGAPGRG
ncbi:hypothetical protein C0J09_10990 [Bordetella avium]|nr:hypothetical protein C0J09_10990 [Bordetella avium]